jgi:hypothetical protein
MSKKFLTSALAIGLLSSTVTTQAANLMFSHETTGFLFENVTNLWTGAFVVDNALDSRGVVVATEVYGNLWTSVYSFEPLLVVWDANGNIVLDVYGDKAYQVNRNPLWQSNATIYLGQMDDGIYYFTIGNAPNQLVKDTVDFNDVGASFAYYGGSPSTLYGPFYNLVTTTGQWRVHVAGVSAIPEPETWAMLLVGLAVMGSVARRRKR